MTATRNSQGAEHVLDRLRDAAPVRERLRALAQGDTVAFEHVT